MIGHTDRDELPLVMREISEAMSARSAALTLHPTGGGASSVVYLDPASPFVADAPLLLEMADAFVAQGREDEHDWHPGFAHRGAAVLHVPVERIDGHGRLVITVLFDRLTDAARQQAEAVYLARRPFAVGYFRLWQVARIRDRYAEALETVLHMTDNGVILIDRDGDIAFANEAANLILASGDGLRRKHHSVRATNLADGVRLQMALDHTTAANGDAPPLNGQRSAPVMALHRKDGSALIASIVATETQAVEPSDIAAILYLVDPQQDPGETLGPLCRLYQLSPVETGLVGHLVAGRTVQELAELMHIKEQTARSYLKQIFVKTSTNRQTELVVLMLSSLIRMKHPIMQEALGGRA